MADPSSSALHQQSQSILTEKVARALTVRTETPAMKAALDALSHLHSAESSNDAAGGASVEKDKTSSSSKNNKAFAFAIDSRSVRVAIEQDALQQALLLQKELRSLVDTVQGLRQGVSEVATIAQRVREATMMQVITSETPTPMLVDSSTSHLEGSGVAAEPGQQPPLTPPSSAVSVKTDAAAGSLEEEQKLANLLSDSFLHRDMCRKRLEAVHAFLERFDLSQEDSRLLDHYAFEDVAVGGGGTVAAAADTDSNNTVVNGLAFLNALERVRKIRLALSDTFGSSGDMALLGGSGSSSSASHHDHDYERKGLGASSALRMLESLAQKQERAYERLYHWLQQYLQLFSAGSAAARGTAESNASGVDTTDGLDEALQHPFVRRSLYTLRHVPAFYTHTLELIASSRRAEETRRFLLALTSGYSGFPPIEMKAHDPVVYVGDMLAFAFKAFSTEADLAKGLLQYTPEDDEEGGGEGQEDSTKAAAADDEPQEGAAANPESSSSLAEKPISAQDMLAMSMSGLARPLKSRILQVVSSLSRRPDDEDAESDDGLNDDFEEEGAGMRARITHLYEISGLLLFYKSVIEKSIHKLDSSSEQQQKQQTEEEQGEQQQQQSQPQPSPHESNPLIACLVDCLGETTTAYEATTRAYGAMLSQISSITGETEAHQAKSMLALVADVRLNSPGYSADVECPEECQTILSLEWASAILVDAALYCCVTLDDVLALKQAIDNIQKAGLSVVAFTKLNESIDEKEQKLVQEIVEKEKTKVLELCGLGNFCTAWRGWQHIKGDGGKLMVSYPGLSQEAAEATMKNFYASLFSPPLPSLEHAVRDPQLRKAARSQIADHVCNVYADLHASIVSSTEGGYQDVSFLAHTPEQVKTLFSA